MLTEKIYYNNSTGEYRVLGENTVIDEEYISNLSLITEQRLNISNLIIVYDLLDNISMMGD